MNRRRGRVLQLGPVRLDSRGETGASLILVLIFVITIGLVASALLSLSGTGLISAVKVREKADTSYDVDGALQAAINTVRNSTYQNAPGQTCLPGGYLDYPGADGSVIKVACAPAADTPRNANTAPGQALLTLGTNSGEHGIHQGPDSVLRVRGRVSSNSTVATDGTPCPQTPQPPTSNCSQIVADGGQIVVTPQCPPDQVTLISNPPADCGSGRTEADPGSVPASAAGYAQPASVPGDLTYRSVPTSCTAPVTFQPGYYDDGAALTNVFATCGATTYWFRPGVYFFDFHNDTGSLWAGPSHVWTVNDAGARVVAGTPTGWNPSPGSFTAPTIPGSCASPQSGTGNNGTEFVFGGDSRLVVTAGQMEVCGRFAGNGAPPIAVYGAKTGGNPSPMTSPWLKTDGTGTDVAGNTAFADPANITQTGETPVRAATATVTAGATTPIPASVVVQGFSPAAAVPAGSVITSALLQVTHRDRSTGVFGVKALTVGVTARNATATTNFTVPTHLDVGPNSAYHVDDLDITSALQAEVHSHGYSGLVVRYDALVPPLPAPTGMPVNEDLDSIQLQLTYTLPSLRSQDPAVSGMPSGCVGTAPYVPGSVNCALITTSGPQTALHVQGLVYAPLAALDINLAGVRSPVFADGMVARSLRMTVTSGAGFTGPVIENPFGPAPLDLNFRAYLCPSSSSCTGADPPSAPWQLAGLAGATFTDTSFVPTSGNRQVIVHAWQIIR
jgi:hypothetical protein